MYPSYNLKNTNISLQATIERSSPHYVDLLVDWVGGLLRKKQHRHPAENELLIIEYDISWL